jgi:C-terminal processing protease CtpA/Prc
MLLASTLVGCTQPELPLNQKLYFTAKIWGFLKYYHAEINKGQINWDDQLVEIIHKLPAIKSEKELSLLYLNWINSLGEITSCKNCLPPKERDYFDKNFDLSWLEDDFFSAELRDKLSFIEHNRSQVQYYVSREGAETLFNHEPVYKSSQWSNEDIRLISLFKYWNVIEYFYPYKYLTDQKWDEVLTEMIPKFRQVASEQEYHLMLNELTVKLCDSHGFFSTELVRSFAGKKFISARFKIVGDKAYVTGFYNDSLARLDDIRLGDAITKVNDEPVLDIYSRNEKYINGSNQWVKKLGYAFRWIFNGNVDSVKMTFERNGVTSSKTIKRYVRGMFKQGSPKREKWRRVDSHIGYANMEQIEEADVAPMMRELANTSAIILDLRNYPAFILDTLSFYFHREPREIARFIAPDLTYPGKFVWMEPVKLGKKNPSPYGGHVVILVDEGTQSRAEYFAMALQAVKGAITIGRQTSGADGNVSDYTFFDNNTTWITGLGVFYPDKRQTQRIGIVPDIKVDITLDDIKQGRDEILEKAIDVARGF